MCGGDNWKNFPRWVCSSIFMRLHYLNNKWYLWGLCKLKINIYWGVSLWFLCWGYSSSVHKCGIYVIILTHKNLLISFNWLGGKSSFLATVYLSYYFSWFYGYVFGVIFCVVLYFLLFFNVLLHCLMYFIDLN